MTTAQRVKQVNTDGYRVYPEPKELEKELEHWFRFYRPHHVKTGLDPDEPFILKDDLKMSHVLSMYLDNCPLDYLEKVYNNDCEQGKYCWPCSWYNKITESLINLGVEDDTKKKPWYWKGSPEEEAFLEEQRKQAEKKAAPRFEIGSKVVYKPEGQIGVIKENIGTSYAIITVEKTVPIEDLEER